MNFRKNYDFTREQKCNIVFRNEGEVSKAVWIFSPKNSSKFESGVVPKVALAKTRLPLLYVWITAAMVHVIHLIGPSHVETVSTTDEV